jgi:hypothetical protein
MGCQWASSGIPLGACRPSWVSVWLALCSFAELHAKFDGRSIALAVVSKKVIIVRGAEMIEILCGRCDRAGRLLVARLLAKYGDRTPVWEIMEAQIGVCPNREARNIAERCSVYCPDLSRRFVRPGTG